MIRSVCDEMDGWRSTNVWTFGSPPSDYSLRLYRHSSGLCGDRYSRLTWQVPFVDTRMHSGFRLSKLPWRVTTLIRGQERPSVLAADASVTMASDVLQQDLGARHCGLSCSSRTKRCRARLVHDGRELPSVISLAPGVIVTVDADTLSLSNDHASLRFSLTSPSCVLISSVAGFSAGL
jgi:hypothetical protein